MEKASLAEYVENANEPILRKLKNEEMVKYENPLQEKKQHIFRERETRWKNKVLHGKLVETINNTCVQTSEWLRTARLKPTTEALITAAQDQALNTNWHSCHILKTKQTDKCRRCGEHPETVSHIISGCPKLGQTAYLERQCCSINSTLESD